MIPEARAGRQGWRAALAALAFAATALIIYGLFSSGFGRPPRAALETPQPVPAPSPADDRPPATVTGDRPPATPASDGTPAEEDRTPAAADRTAGAGDRAPAAAAAVPARRAAAPALAVISGDLWLTYLPTGLVRGAGGTIAPEPGVEGRWARWSAGGDFVEARVEQGAVAAGWAGYRERVAVLNARAITVRGRPAVVGEHPKGGRVIAWLERAGTGAWIRVSDSLAGELLTIATSVRAPVGD
ncbi:hypothetical protein E1292_09820 [Nonomuraea deserti]|uniref:Uncharacterized protein n=1 Tax=Nonomuraea deserti TaxID=1848322 RepID=A0A4R4VVI6_9ACTN|nr:hypothetical protein [Nonomuraea deserti]TDD09371.1 hypothetical protein E1292_09820 [Nonomuraea deserti]